MGESHSPPRNQDRHRLLGWPGILVLLTVSIFYLEIVLRLRTGAPFANDGLLYTTLFAGVTALLVHLVASFFHGPGRAVVTGLALGAITFLFMSQLIYYDIFQTFYTVFSAINSGQVLQFMDDILAKIGENAPWLLLLLLPLLAYLALVVRRTGTRYRFTWRQRGTAAGLMVALFALAVVGINVGDQGQASAHDLYYRSGHPVTSVNRLGLLTSMRLDLQRTVLGLEARSAPPPVAAPQAPDHLDAPVATRSQDPSVRQGGGAGAPVQEPVVHEDNIMDIDFETLMAEADGEELRNTHLYFSMREPTRQNEHTGMFEGYNLIFLTAEAYSHYAVDEHLTPTLHEMTHEGFTFTNFYNPLWGVSTSDGEYVATTGLIPKSGVWSMYASGTNSMPFAMGNQLRGLGYETRAYHNHTFDYYRRDVSHPNLGYDYQGVGNGLALAGTWPESDLEMIDVTTSDYLEHAPFHAYYMTVSGHLQYNFGGNFIARKNQDLVQDLPYGEAGRAYLATQIELDRALELLMERLEEAGQADNTLIVLSADHYPYGLTQDEIEELAGGNVDRNFELHRSSLIIYAKGMEPEIIDRPVSSLDIIPTISNLMGLDFDSRLLMGVDAFSDTDPLVIFANRSFITDQGRYNGVTREFVPDEGVEVPEGYQQLVSDEIDRQFYYSTMILDRDYYDLVLDR